MKITKTRRRRRGERKRVVSYVSIEHYMKLVKFAGRRSFGAAIEELISSKHAGAKPLNVPNEK